MFGKHSGGGVWITRGGLVPPVLVWNYVVDNTAAEYGGGISIENDADAMLLMNLRISGNTAVRGGGVAINDASMLTSVLGNTISSNSADFGGGIWAHDFNYNISTYNKINRY